jgi:hypothetical protein
MVWSVISNFNKALKYRGGVRGLLEHMYTVRDVARPGCPALIRSFLCWLVGCVGRTRSTCLFYDAHYLPLSSLAFNSNFS